MLSQVRLFCLDSPLKNSFSGLYNSEVWSARPLRLNFTESLALEVQVEIDHQIKLAWLNKWSTHVRWQSSADSLHSKALVKHSNSPVVLVLLAKKQIRSWQVSSISTWASWRASKAYLSLRIPNYSSKHSCLTFISNLHTFLYLPFLSYWFSSYLLCLVWSHRHLSRKDVCICKWKG